MLIGLLQNLLLIMLKLTEKILVVTINIPKIKIPKVGQLQQYVLSKTLEQKDSPKPKGPCSLGFSFYSLQILLDPLRRGHAIFLLEGSVEDGLAFESGALRDALDGGGQVCSFA